MSVLTGGGRRPSPAPQEVAPGVHLLTLGRGAAASNVYLVRSDSAWTLVDAGWASSAAAIRTAAESVFGPGARPAAILLTHLHPDHSGSAGSLGRSWRVPVYVGADELPMAAGRYLPRYAMPLDRWLVAPLMRLLPPRIRARIEAAGSITDVVGPLDPQGRVPAMADWEWVPTPGHTPGHVAYLRRGDGVLIAGDGALTVDLNSVGGVLLGGQRVAGPPRYTTWDWPAATRSVGALADLEPRVLVPGHGRPLSVGTAAALAALAQDRPRARSRRRGPWGLVPRYSAGDRYRPNPGASTVRHNEKAKKMNALTYSIERVIRRPPEDVFDYCSDLRSELRWNPKVKYVEKLTDGPVGVGTRYRARWANSGPTAVEVVQFDRPRTWETHARARGMSIRFRGTVAEAPAGARYTADLALHPRGLARLVAPLALRAMRRQDQRNMQRISEALESGASTQGRGDPAGPALHDGRAPAWPR